MGTATLAVDGGRLRYEDVGSGPAVVLIHGFSLDMRMWDGQVRDLAATFRVIRGRPAAAGCVRKACGNDC